MNAKIRCQYSPLEALGPLDESATRKWLSAGEQEYYSSVRAAERRTTWLAGRIVAKTLLCDRLATAGTHCAATDLDIESRNPSRSLGQRPRILLWGKSLEFSLSIAHTSRGVLAGLAAGTGQILGVDLVLIDPAASSLDWSFTANEQRLIDASHADSHVAQRLWAMKEAVYKACGNDRGFVPRQIDISNVQLSSSSMHPLAGLECLQTWRVDRHVAALAVAQATQSTTNAGAIAA